MTNDPRFPVEGSPAFITVGESRFPVEASPAQFSQVFSTTAGSAIDWWGGQIQVAELGRPRPRNSFTSRQIRRGRTPLPIIEWTMRIADLSGGMGVYYNTDWLLYPNFYQYGSAVDASVPGLLTLSNLVQSTSAPVPSGNAIGVHGLMFSGVLYWGVGSGANVSLVKETSATDPAPAVVTYSPTSAITGLYPIIIGGITTAVKMAITRNADVIDLHTTPGTSAATMHASTSSAWWIAQSSLPTRPIGIQAGNTIYNNLTAASGTGDAPTASETVNVLDGGYLIRDMSGQCEFQLRGRPWRIYFVEPKTNTTGGLLTAGSEALGYVRSVNLEFTDKQPFPWKTFPNGVLQVAPINGGLLATDGFRVAFHDGETEVNLRIFDDMPYSLYSFGVALSGGTTLLLRCRGFVINANTAYAIVQALGDGVNDYFQLWKLSWATRRWHIASIVTSTGATGGTSKGILAGGGHPFSYSTGFMQFRANNWYRMFTRPEGESIYYRGTTVNPPDQSALTGTIYLPIIALPGELSHYPNVVSEVKFGGDSWRGSSDGTTAASVSFAWATRAANTPSVAKALDSTLVFSNNLSATFDISEPASERIKRFDSPDSFYEFWPSITMTRSSSGAVTPQALPWIIKGYTFLDGEVRSPAEVRGY